MLIPLSCIQAIVCASVCIGKNPLSYLCIIKGWPSGMPSPALWPVAPSVPPRLPPAVDSSPARRQPARRAAPCAGILSEPAGRSLSSSHRHGGASGASSRRPADDPSHGERPPTARPAEIRPRPSRAECTIPRRAKADPGRSAAPAGCCDGRGGWGRTTSGILFSLSFHPVHSSFVHFPISSILSSSFQKFMQAGMQIALPVI